MMERFNFLDLFGYLIPGATLLVLTWFPYGLENGVWPSAELSAGIVALGVAYVLGHVLQGLARVALPSTDEDDRYPSDWLLDDHDARALPERVRQVLSMLVARRFAISLRGNGQVDRTVRNRRASVFRLCRSALVQKEAAAYVEQFEGMYYLMRGLAAAFIIGTAYLTGWVLAILLKPPLQDAPFYGIVVLAAIASALMPRWLVRRGLGRIPGLLDRWGLWTAGAVLLLVGATLVSSETDVQPAWGIGLVGIVAAFSAFRCWRSSLEFQRNFAQAVYQDFIALETQTPRELFGELTAQRAFERWLAGDHDAATPAADWLASEAELKKDLTRRELAKRVKEVVGENNAEAWKTKLDSLVRDEPENESFCLTAIAVVSNDRVARQTVCERLDAMISTDSELRNTLAAFLRIWRRQGATSIWAKSLDKDQDSRAARLELACAKEFSLANAIKDLTRKNLAKRVKKVVGENNAKAWETKLGSLVHDEPENESFCLTTIAVVSNDPVARQTVCKRLDAMISTDSELRNTLAAFLRILRRQGTTSTWAKSLDKDQDSRAARLESACGKGSLLANAIEGKAGS